MNIKLMLIILMIALNPISGLQAKISVPVIYSAIQAPYCSQEKINSILSQPVYENENFRNYREIIDCSATLPKGSVIKKTLIFNQSNVVFDCNGASIRPLTKGPVIKRREPKGPINTGNPNWNSEYQSLLMDFYHSIAVTSKRSEANGIYQWHQTKNVTIKNCTEVLGSVNIFGSNYIPNDQITHKKYKNTRGPAYVDELRNSSPTNIILDNITIINKRKNNAVYIHQGVTHFVLKNSNIFHDSSGVSLYLSAESGFHLIENNIFHHNSTNWFGLKPRELLAIDSSERNVIRKNWFSGLKDGDGGILLYRNCGEKGQIRYTAPRYNQIEENTFYYSKSVFGQNSTDHPPVIIGSRNGDSPGLLSYCDKDEGHYWDYSDVNPDLGWDTDWQSSSTIDLDLARYNRVRNNRVCNKIPYLKVSNPQSNYGNTIAGNYRINCETSTPLPR